MSVRIVILFLLVMVAMALLRGTDFELPLQFDNFRD